MSATRETRERGGRGASALERRILVNILIVAPRYHINLRDRVRALQRAGHRVAMLVQHRGVSENHADLSPEVIGYSIAYRLPARIGRALGVAPPRNAHLRLGLPPPVRLLRRMRARAPELVVVKGLGHPLGVAALLAARRLGVTAVALVQRERLAAGAAAERATARLVFAGLGARALVSPVCDPDEADAPRHPRFHYLPFVCEVQDFERSYLPEGVVRILNVGNFLPSKDQLTLLRAVQRLEGRHRLHVELIGPRLDEDWVRRLRDFAEHGGLAGSVSFHFEQPHDAVVRAYRRADVFVLSSRREPASLQVLEAMANGVPVVSSDGNGTRCYIEPGRSGFVFRAGRADDLADKIDRIVRDPLTLAAMGRRSRELARERHDPDRFARELVRLAGS